MGMVLVFTIKGSDKARRNIEMNIPTSPEASPELTGVVENRV